MMMHLVKKDFLLAKKYWIVMLIASVALPVFIHIKLGFMAQGFLTFFLSTLYILYLLFSTVSMIEYKYRGSTFLCATPYTRQKIVKSKYYFALTIFIGCYMLYTVTAFVAPVQMDVLGPADIGWSFLIITVIFGAIIPVQFYFGYEKSKYIFMFFVFLMPFVFPTVLKSFQASGAGLAVTLPGYPLVQDALLALLALLIGRISMEVSVRIYANKNL
ncbi:ABC-2 transporter permease [Paenibacillus hodogayensis]|uniref:ABC-2 transporter permease n=1 Tax=Paenibacillus hodogayensis TaxID=279208 RepID=A0ABV5W1U6_9BACL